jgi:hypothetical protein
MLHDAQGVGISSLFAAVPEMSAQRSDEAQPFHWALFVCPLRVDVEQQLSHWME